MNPEAAVSEWELRFWSKICKTDSCWLWTASTNSTGYGQIKVNGKMLAGAKSSQRIGHPGRV